MTVVDPSYRLLACEYLREQLEVLMRELLGVRRNEEIEPVHQARVASRRVRAALRMFADCFDTKAVARWQKQVKKLTKELGAARDKDVQIEFVAEFLAALDKKDRKHRPGVERLLLRLRRGRSALQAQVVDMLDKLEETNTLAQMYGELEKSLFTLRSREVQVCSPYVYERAGAHIRERQDDLMAYERTLDDPKDVHGHHQMRIAAKKLRYTMEICSPAYEGQLAAFIDPVKRVQSLLGDIHDCDVWVVDIDEFMERERLATIEYFGQDRAFNRLKPGLQTLRDDRKAQRRKVFEEMLEYWQGLDEEHLWETLAETLRAREEAGDQPGVPPEDRRTDVGKEEIPEDRTAE
jgi:CHAD domain-containing protein